MPNIVARWRDWDDRGLEHLSLTETDAGLEAISVIIGRADPADGGAPFAARYRILCDPLWRVRELDVELIGEPVRLSVTADGKGNWLDAAGSGLGFLDGAVDVDLAASPFTNTLPIRRLDPAEGEAVDIVTAYLRFPALTLSPDPQRYTCLKHRRRYRYDSLDSDFSAEIEVDGDGLVTSYPGLFRRHP